MVHFSKKEDYAVILLNKLAAAYKKKLVPLSEIAKEYNISLLFLRNIALDLRRARIINAVEGRDGGYRLIRSPKQVTIGEIIKAISHRQLFSCCQNTPDGKCVVRSCPHGFSLKRLNNKFLEKISGFTLDQTNRLSK